MELPQNYNPSLIQQTQNTLYANHYKFEIERLPDLSFFVQSASIPSVSTGLALQENPFSVIQHPGDRLSYGSFEVTYLIDSKFKNYFSLYYWMKGFGFPHDFEEVTRFREKQRTLVGNMRPNPIDLEKTRATLMVLLPDTSKIVAEILMVDVFPYQLSPIMFSTTEFDAPLLKATCLFSCTTFDVKTYL